MQDETEGPLFTRKQQRKRTFHKFSQSTDQPMCETRRRRRDRTQEREKKTKITKYVKYKLKEMSGSVQTPSMYTIIARVLESIRLKANDRPTQSRAI